MNSSWSNVDSETLDAVRALVDSWVEVPDYTASDYDRGRVDQRHDMIGQLLKILT